MCFAVYFYCVMIVRLVLCAVILSHFGSYCQFPAICNTPINLVTKVCCPNYCGGPERGTCRNVTAEVVAQWELANSTITGILRDTPNQPQKGTADSRYLWPTVVFESVCECFGNFGGIDCSECDFGWTGEDCNMRKTPVIRKSFSRLTTEEKQNLVTATVELKKEMGIWSVVVEEPVNYTSGTVTLQNVSTYNYFAYVHQYAVRDLSPSCRQVNDNHLVDFAHSGPVFLVWHRRFLLNVEKEFQRIMNNESFGLPYWQWEENDRSPFTKEYYGVPPTAYGPAVNVSGDVINSQDWNTICDLYYFNPKLNCLRYWKPCNPANDLKERKPLQRGHGTDYLPSVVEVMIAIAAPFYDTADGNGDYTKDVPRASSRNRIEGWINICSAVPCIGRRNPAIKHMHNSVHNWVGGQMYYFSSSTNDPIFNIHHCNVDRVFESWMNRFSTDSLELLPSFVSDSGNHPGHNQNDYMVPFLPLIKAGKQYAKAEEWGYKYDRLIPANIPDYLIPDCEDVVDEGYCPRYDANSTCIEC